MHFYRSTLSSTIVSVNGANPYLIIAPYLVFRADRTATAVTMRLMTYTKHVPWQDRQVRQPFSPQSETRIRPRVSVAWQQAVMHRPSHDDESQWLETARELREMRTLLRAECLWTYRAQIGSWGPYTTMKGNHSKWMFGKALVSEHEALHWILPFC